MIKLFHLLSAVALCLAGIALAFLVGPAGLTGARPAHRTPRSIFETRRAGLA